METAAFEGSWETARWLEVARLEERGAEVLLAARRPWTVPQAEDPLEEGRMAIGGLVMADLATGTIGLQLAEEKARKARVERKEEMQIGGTPTGTKWRRMERTRKEMQRSECVGFHLLWGSEASF